MKTLTALSCALFLSTFVTKVALAGTVYVDRPVIVPTPSTSSPTCLVKLNGYSTLINALHVTSVQWATESVASGTGWGNTKIPVVRFYFHLGNTGFQTPEPDALIKEFHDKASQCGQPRKSP